MVSLYTATKIIEPGLEIAMEGFPTCYPLFLNPTLTWCTIISAFWISSSGISVNPISILILICSNNSRASAFTPPLEK